MLKNIYSEGVHFLVGVPVYAEGLTGLGGVVKWNGGGPSQKHQSSKSEVLPQWNETRTIYN